MFELKKGKTQYVPVRMINTNGDGQAAINYTDVSASLLLGGTTIVNIGVSASSWFEASGSVFSSTGVYSLLLHSASLTTTGSFAYAVSAGPNVPAVKYVGVLKIVEVESADLFNRIGVPVAADISADLQNLSSSLILTSGSLRNEILTTRTILSSTMVNVSASLGGASERLRVVSEGRWKLDTVTNKMTFYTLADPTVPFLVFGMSGSNGLPTTADIHERRPTS